MAKKVNSLVKDILQNKYLYSSNSNELQKIHKRLAPYLGGSDGPRTVGMLQLLDMNLLPGFNSEDRTLSHGGLSYQIITGKVVDIYKKPSAYVNRGVLAAEICLLDPRNSPFMKIAYTHFLNVLKILKPTSLEMVLKIVTNEIEKEIFPEKNFDQVDSILSSWKKDAVLTKDRRSIPVIPLDHFIKMKAGKCRHHAVLLKYIVERLISETDYIPKGRLHLVRDYVSGQDGNGGHAWNLYVPDHSSKCYHLDSLWKIAKECSSPEDRSDLHKKYGKAVIDLEIERFYGDRT